MTQEFWQQQLQFALLPLAALHDSWHPWLGEQLSIPEDVWQHPQGQRYLNHALCAHIGLRPYLPDFLSLPMRSLLLASGAAEQFVLRLGLLLWWDCLECAIDGRARRAMYTKLGQGGVAVMEAAYARAAPARAFIGKRNWEGETVLRHSAYGVWLGVLGIAQEPQITKRLCLRLLYDPALAQVHPPATSEALVDIFQWLLRESFPQCSWLST